MTCDHGEERMACEACQWRAIAQVRDRQLEEAGRQVADLKARLKGVKR